MTVVPNYGPFRKPSPVPRDRFAWGERELIRIGPMVCGLHALGTRPLYEYLRELVGPDLALGDDAEQLLKRYARLDPNTIVALDGRELQLPLAVVQGARQ